MVSIYTVDLNYYYVSVLCDFNRDFEIGISSTVDRLYCGRTMRLAFLEYQYDGFPWGVANYLRSKGTYVSIVAIYRLMLIRTRVRIGSYC